MAPGWWARLSAELAAMAVMVVHTRTAMAGMAATEATVLKPGYPKACAKSHFINSQVGRGQVAGGEIHPTLVSRAWMATLVTWTRA